jgi:hypothetical protein
MYRLPLERWTFYSLVFFSGFFYIYLFSVHLLANVYCIVLFLIFYIHVYICLFPIAFLLHLSPSLHLFHHSFLLPFPSSLYIYLGFGRFLAKYH